MASVSKKAYEEIIGELNKSFRAVNLYPPNHPALKNTLQRSYTVLRSYLDANGQLELITSRNGFLYQTEPFLQENSSLAAFSKELFRRRMKKIFFLEALTVEELESFFTLTGIDPEVMHRQGGVETMLARRRVRNVMANEINYERLRQEEEEEQDIPDFEEEEPRIDESELDAEQQKLFKLLQVIDGERDVNKYLGFLKQAVDIAKGLIEKGGTEKTYFLLAALGRLSFDESRSSQHRDYARKALAGIASKEVVEYLLGRVAAGGKVSEGKNIQTVLRAIGARATTPLVVSYLLAERDQVRAKRTLEAVGDLGDEAVPVLEEIMKDSRREVGLVSARMLGLIASESAVRPLQKALGHPDLHVAAEATNSLGRIRSPRAYALLIRLLPKAPPKIGEMIVQNFGEIGDPANIELLERIVTGQVALSHLKESAIKALARIGGERAAPILLETIGQEGRFSNKKSRPLRLSAAAALGAVADNRSLEALGRWSLESDDPSVRRACWDAIAAISARYNLPVAITSANADAVKSDAGNSAGNS